MSRESRPRFIENQDFKEKFFRLTPLGRAESEVRHFSSEVLESRELEKYSRSLNKYRSAKLINIILKGLLYAGLITSLATTFGLPQAYLLQKVASYIGVTLILVLYGFSKYISNIYKEEYHVQREIVISKAAERKAKN